MINEFESKVLAGLPLTESDASVLAETALEELPGLFSAAERIRRRFFGDTAELCTIINAKSGACPEDCAYCAQSSLNKSAIEIFPFIGAEAIIARAAEAKKCGIQRFSVVTSGRKPAEKELKEIARAFDEMRKIGIGTCASLGLLKKDELSYLRDHGLERYHNNLETSERFFPFICSTHSFADKLETIAAARSAGLSLCSGGIFGMGETWLDRISLALTLRSLEVDSVPVNFLNPIKGTRLDHRPPLSSDEALKVISFIRFMIPQKEIRVCGGRIQTLGYLHSTIFKAGADSVMTGNYLVTTGRTFEDDLQMLKEEGLRLRTG